MPSDQAAANIASQSVAPTRNKGGRPKGKATRPMEKAELERFLAGQIRSKKVPPQYKSAISSNLAALKGWTKAAGDDANKIEITSMLKAWSRERIYGGQSAQDLTPQGLAGNGGVACANGVAASSEQAGGIPQANAVEGGLSPSPTTTTQKSESQVMPATPEEFAVGMGRKSESPQSVAAVGVAASTPASGFWRRSKQED